MTTTAVPTTLLKEKHVAFVDRLYKLPPDSLESLMTQHIRINGIYWALISLSILNCPHVLPRGPLIDEILACQDVETGGFGSAPGHDPHVVCTLHAVQILILLDATHHMDADKTAAWIASLQLPSGAVQGDKWGEIDMRINYAAAQCLALLSRLDAINVAQLQRFVLSCRNFDGGFGMLPGAESHAAHAFTSLGTLAILCAHQNMQTGATAASLADLIDVDQTAWWLCLRQVKSGGLNGRPEKLEDVCYSWWVLASLDMLHRTAWIDCAKLRQFILASQDVHEGGMSDRPGDVADINHTCFGLAGLALMGHEGLLQIDSRYCMPLRVTQRLRL